MKINTATSINVLALFLARKRTGLKADSVTIPITIVRETHLSLPQRVLVVVHPNLEDPSIYPNLIAEFLHRYPIALRHLPTQFLTKQKHLLLLFLSEFCSDSLSSKWVLRPHHSWMGVSVVLLIVLPRRGGAERQERLWDG